MLENIGQGGGEEGGGRREEVFHTVKGKYKLSIDGRQHDLLLGECLQHRT